jgi:hypothetical protein
MVVAVLLPLFAFATGIFFLPGLKLFEVFVQPGEGLVPIAAVVQLLETSGIRRQVSVVRKSARRRHDLDRAGVL